MTSPGFSTIELAERLGLALGLSIVLGLAFEEIYKLEERAIPGGIRTFPMLAISGAMLYLIEPQHALAFVVGIGALAIWLNSYIRAAAPADGKAASLMIPASNMLAYALGPIALSRPPWVALAVSITAVILLGAREQLHKLVRVVPRDELLTAGQFLVLAGIILPLLPDQPVTKLTPLTPYHVWLAVVAIAGLSYASYLVQRYVPTREGKLLPAILGGIYSSTATTVVLSRRQKELGGERPDLVAGIVAATAIMYLRLDGVVAIFDLHLAILLAPALAGLFAIAAAMTAFEWRKVGPRTEATSLAVPSLNPLELGTAVVFAALFVVVSILSAWVGGTFGQKGIFTLAAAVGVTDIDPFVLTIAQGGVTGIGEASLAAAIIIAASSNNVVKGIYAVAFGGLASSRRAAAMLVALALLGFAVAAAYIL